MKIFYITSVLGDSGGSEIYTRDLLRELIKRGHELMVCTTEKYKLEGAKMVFIPSFLHHGLHKFTAPFFFRRVVKACEKFKPDLIQSHSNSFMGLLAHICKKKFKVPHVLLIELISSENKTIHTKTIFQCEKFLLPKLNYDKLVVWTENMKNKFLIPWGIPVEKIFVMPAALNLKNYPLEKYPNEFNERYGMHLITSIKNLWGSNVLGLEYIVKAMKIVTKKYPEYKYVIFGSGSDKKRLEELVEKMKLQKVVKFHGAINPRDCRKVWAATEIAPHSYVYEFSTSISLLEYLAAGKACVVTDIGSVKELVKDAALVVKAEDEKAMADGIMKLIENQELRKKLEKRARELVKKEYSIKKSVDRLEKVYAEVLKNA